MKIECKDCTHRRGDIEDGVCRCVILGQVDLPTFKCPCYTKAVLNLERYKTAEDAVEAFAEHIHLTNPEQDPDQGAVYEAADAISWMYCNTKDNGVMNA